MDYHTLTKEELIRRLALAESTCRDLRTQHEDEADQRDAQGEALHDTVEQLEESHRRYAELYDFAPVAYCTLDRNGLILEINLSGAAMLGRDRQTLAGNPFLALARFEDTAAFAAHLRQALASPVPVTTELTFSTDKGKQEMQVVSAPAHRYAGGRADACRTAFLDISRRRRAESKARAAHESETRLRHRLERIDHASVVVGAALASLSAADSTAFFEVILAEGRAIVNAERAALRIVEPGKADRWIASASDREWAASLDGDARPPGTPLLAAPIRYGSLDAGALYLGNAAGAGEFTVEDRLVVEMLAERVATAMEIARLRRIEAREHQRLEFLAQAGSQLAESIEYDATLDAIVHLVVPRLADLAMIDLVNQDGSVTKTLAHHPDPEKQRLLDRLVGTTPAAGLPADVRAVIETACAQRSDVGVRLLHDHLTDAAYREVLDGLGATSTLLAPLILRGRVIGILRLVMAESGRRFAEDDSLLVQEIANRAALAIEDARLYREAQSAIRARDNLLAAVTHDVRNYLTTIVVATELLLNRPAAEDRRRGRKQLDSIRHSAERLRTLISSLRDATMIETGHFTVVPRPEPVAPILDEALRTLEPQAEARSLTLGVEAVDRELSVHCDRERVLQVIANLVGNALKFTPPGGHVRVGAQKLGDRVRFSVADTGAGIASEEMGQIFERYFSTGDPRARSTGLGLFIAKGIVEAHGGRIWVESQVGSGTTLYFTLALAPPDDARRAAEGDPTAPPSQLSA